MKFSCISFKRIERILLIVYFFLLTFSLTVSVIQLDLKYFYLAANRAF